MSYTAGHLLPDYTHLLSLQNTKSRTINSLLSFMRWKCGMNVQQWITSEQSTNHIIVNTIYHTKTSASATVYLNSIVVWNVTQHRLLKHRRFGTTYRSHLDGWNVQETGALNIGPKGRQKLEPWNWGQRVVPKRRRLTNLHSITFQKTKNIHHVGHAHLRCRSATTTSFCSKNTCNFKALWDMHFCYYIHSNQLQHYISFISMWCFYRCWLFFASWPSAILMFYIPSTF
jgi:hypothetical protein